ncbi:MAG: isoaspartyl peptidase/L-asparaginase [Planctomycetota bacterium]
MFGNRRCVSWGRMNWMLVFACCGWAAPPLDAEPAAVKWAIALHGGAGSSPADDTKQQIARRRDALKQALSVGVEILSAGGGSLDAVEAVVRVMEDDPLFNAGKGAVFAADGSHELDASIMTGRRYDGQQRACGAVASIKHAQHPITVARRVMEQTDHVLLVGPGADAFARRMRVSLVDNDFFDTETRREQWKRASKQREGSAPPKRRSGGSTVGCVALDMLGNLSAATSTGGMSHKMAGRVGDSPLVGAGTYADNATCAVSCTGHGEHFIRHAVAYDISARMAYRSESLQEAVDGLFADRLQPNWGGLVAVSANGAIYMKYNTGGMARAAANSNGLFDVFWGVEDAPAEDQNDKP